MYPQLKTTHIYSIDFKEHVCLRLKIRVRPLLGLNLALTCIFCVCYESVSIWPVGVTKRKKNPQDFVVKEFSFSPETLRVTDT